MRTMETPGSNAARVVQSRPFNGSSLTALPVSTPPVSDVAGVHGCGSNLAVTVCSAGPIASSTSTTRSDADPHFNTRAHSRSKPLAVAVSG